ncbi:hypothetical protein [Chryseobacterium sp.]|uniref:hypothetical protein n=1 Tax=Chryseobacterium sp. TaxID=1871047 RepID=UPI00321AAF50
MLKDFDITQIDKDTKVVVFHIPSEVMAENHEQLYKYISLIKSQLGEIGVLALFVDESIKVSPLMDELLNCGNLKTLEK